jgi:hypothetical protein
MYTDDSADPGMQKRDRRCKYRNRNGVLVRRQGKIDLLPEITRVSCDKPPQNLKAEDESRGAPTGTPRSVEKFRAGRLSEFMARTKEANAVFGCRNLGLELNWSRNCKTKMLIGSAWYLLLESKGGT